jgi:tetratricopeptide (TPR) repeat protein
LSRDPQSHLSPKELAGLAEETEATAPAASALFDREQAKAHADGCSVCGHRLRDHRSVQASLRSMANPVASERTSECPPDDKWTAVAAGVYSAEQCAPLLEHASHCDHCGHLLRTATEDLNPEISSQEQERIRQLPSSSAGWQRDVARKMAEMSGATPAPDISGRRETRARVARYFSGWMRWAVPAAAAAVLVVGAALWIERTPSLSSTNRLIAQAYTAQRPIELRFPGASYGPVRQQRGAQSSRMDEPPELLEAESQIARGLASHPQDAGWLQAKARTGLLEGNYQAAIEGLQRAEALRPQDDSLKIDLATAYFGRAETKRNPADQTADYDLALRALNDVLARNPKDLVALFNRAMVYQRQKKYPEGLADWQRYLQFDPEGEWAGEARRHVEALRLESHGTG